VYADVLGEDRDDLVGQVDRPLGLVLRRPDDDGDPAGSFDEVLARGDVCGLGSLELPGHAQRAAEEVDVTDLHTQCLAATEPRERAECDVRGEPWP
jgi:hypothetical protein